MERSEDRYKYIVLETCQQLSMGISGASDLPQHHYELYKWLGYRLDNWEPNYCKSTTGFDAVVKILVNETLRMYEERFGED